MKPQYLFFLAFLATSHAAKSTMLGKMLYQPELYPPTQSSNPLGELNIPKHQKQATVDDYIAKRVQQAVDWAYYKADLRVKEQNEMMALMKDDIMKKNANIQERTRALIM